MTYPNRLTINHSIVIVLLVALSGLLVILLLPITILLLLGVPHTDLGCRKTDLSVTFNVDMDFGLKDVTFRLGAVNSNNVLTLLHLVWFNHDVDLLLFPYDLRSGDVNLHFRIITLGLTLLEVDIKLITLYPLIFRLNSQLNISLFNMDGALSFSDGAVTALNFVTFKSLTNLVMFTLGVLGWDTYFLSYTITFLTASYVFALVLFSDFEGVSLLFLLVGRHAVYLQTPDKTK